MTLARLTPPAGPPRLLALAQLANSVGDGAYLVCSALYFTRIVGLPPEQVGLGLTLAWGLGSVAGVPLGHLADRRGPRGTAVVLALTTAASVAGLLAARSFAAFLLAVCAYAVGQCGLAAARQALLAALVRPEERTGLLAYLQSTLNAGLGAGAALGGLALHAGTRTAYVAVLAVDVAGFVVCAAVLSRLPAVPPRPRVAAAEPAFAVLRDRRYALVTALNAVLLLRMPLLSLVVPLWVVEHTSAPGWIVAALLLLNTAAVTLAQVWAARAVTGLASAGRAVRRSGVLLLASCAVFALSAYGGSAAVAAGVLLAAAALQVAGEMLQSAGSWQIAFDLAPSDRQGQYQGFFGAGTAAARTLGPALLTPLVLSGGTAGWLVLGALFLAAAHAMGPATRLARPRALATDGRP